VLTGRLFAVGGNDANFNALSSVERYDEEKDQWEIAASTMNIARYGLGVCVLGGRLFAVGGRDDNFHALSSVERYDEAKDQWEVVTSIGTARAGLGVVVVPPSTSSSPVPSEVLSLDDDY
jgi:hypothetical protein